VNADDGNASAWAADHLITAEVTSGKTGTDAGQVYERRLTLDHVPAASLETLRSGISAEDGYALGVTTARETGNGAGSITSTQPKALAILDAECKRTYVSANGKGDEQEEIIWRNLTDFNADLIVADAKDDEDDMSGATYEATASAHTLVYVKKIPHPNDPLFDVIRLTKITSGLASVPTAWSAQTDKTQYKLQQIYDSSVTTSGYEKIKWRWWEWTYDITFHTNEGDARGAIHQGLDGSTTWHPHTNIWGAKKVKTVKVTTWNTGAIKNNPISPNLTYNSV